MSPKLKLAIIAGGVIGAGLAGYLAYERLYAQRAEEIRTAIGNLEGSNRRLEVTMRNDAEVRRDLEAIIATAIGGERESLEHRLRTAGSALATAAGLQRVEVDSLPPQALGNPAANARGIARGFRQSLQGRVDAGLVRIQIEGRGSLESVLKAMTLAEAQRWSLGIESWTIKPERVAADQPAAFSLTMALSVLFVGDDGAIVGDIPIDPLDEVAQSRLATLVSFDPFRTAPKPQPAVAAKPQQRPAPTPPAPPPAGDGWTLVGVVEGRSGQFAIVVHRDGRRRTLALGQNLGSLRLAAIGSQAATFELGEERFQVQNGEALAAARERKRP